VVAGEASGDGHAARVVAELRRRHGDVEVFGLGRQELLAQGLDPIGSSEVLNLVGLTEVLRRLPAIFRLRNRLLEEVRRRKPTAALLVDLPGFNLHLAGKLKKMGVPVTYYVAPQAWAWRKGRVKKIRRRVDKLCAIFPFEKLFFGQAGVPVEYVGHPLSEKAWGNPPLDERLVAIVPGSRPGEIERLLPMLAVSARLLSERMGRLRFRLPVAPGLDPTRIRQILDQAEVEVELVDGGAPAALRGARLALVTSGTASLEAAFSKVPMVVVYKMGRLSYLLGRAMFRLRHFCIVNILAGKTVVPELLQGRARPAAVVEQAMRMLEEGEARRRALAGMQEVVSALGEAKPSQRVAEVLGEWLPGREVS